MEGGLAMPVVNVGNMIFVIARGTYMGQTTMTTLTYIVDGVSGSEKPYVDVINAFHDEWIDALGGVAQKLAACYSSGMTNITYDYQIVYPVRYIKLTRSSASYSTGSVSGTSLPPNVASVMTLRGDLGNRHNLANKHLGAVPTTFSANGLVTPTGLASYAAYADAAIDQGATVTVDGSNYTMKPIIYNRAVPVDSVGITNYQIGQTTRVERRRTVGLGI